VEAYEISIRQRQIGMTVRWREVLTCLHNNPCHLDAACAAGKSTNRDIDRKSSLERHQ
jgi:hypothetical protein